MRIADCRFSIADLKPGIANRTSAVVLAQWHALIMMRQLAIGNRQF